MQLVYVACLVKLVVHLLSLIHLASSRRLLLEVVVLNAMYMLAPPLLAFAIYFNLYHSQRHVVRVMRMSTWKASPGCTGAVVVIFTLLSTVILAVWYCGMQLTTSKMILDARPMLRPMFIVISVITVPHMVLVHEVVANGDKLETGRPLPEHCGDFKDGSGAGMAGVAGEVEEHRGPWAGDLEKGARQ